MATPCAWYRGLLRVVHFLAIFTEKILQLCMHSLHIYVTHNEAGNIFLFDVRISDKKDARL